MNNAFSRTGWIVAGLLLVASAWGQHEAHHPDAAKPAKTAPSPEMCKMMQAKMDDMHAKMMAKHGELQHMVNEMNAATGQAKVDATARVVTMMADHQAMMHDMGMGMMKQMMAHMGEHMSQGMPPSEKKDMMMCPMMQSKDNDSADIAPEKDSGEAAPEAQEHQH